MFTVKRVNGDGNEFMVQCDSFVREKRSDGFHQYTAHNSHPENDDYVVSWCGDEKGGGITSERIYVMNKQGATVATYCFDEPDWSTEQAA